MTNPIKKHLLEATGSVSGAASVLGSWQVCHNACLALIAVLSVVGITIVGMPLEFLTHIARPLWLFAFALLLVTMVLYVKKKCISGRMLMFNSGLIIAGVPFEPFEQFSVALWVIGGTLALAAILLYVKSKIRSVKK